MDNNNAQIQANKELRDKKLAEQALYDVNSERYQELAEEIQKIDEETLGLLTDNEKLKDSIFELRFNPLDEALEKYDRLNDEIGDFLDLIDEDSYFDKAGKGTANLAAALALMQQGIANSKQKVSDLKTGLEKLEESFKNGVISEKEYNEKSEEFQQSIRDSISVTQKYESQLKDLYLTQMRKEVEATENLIDRYADARHQKEKYYQFSKKVNKQQKNIDSLKAELAAIENINNSYSQARAKRLHTEIFQQQQEMDNMKHEHSLEILETVRSTKN